MSDFLDGLVKELEDKGFVEVDKLHLPDGHYHKYGGGYRIDITDTTAVRRPQIPLFESPSYTGFSIITNNGIRGSWRGERFESRNGVALVKHDNDIDTIDVYKIMTNLTKWTRKEKLDTILK